MLYKTQHRQKSAFCLLDKPLELSTIITKSFPHADLAFVLACQTRTGDEQLPEEAIHLAAGLMLAVVLSRQCGLSMTKMDL